MNATQVFDRFLIKSEKNSTNDFIAVDKGRFVELYTEASNKYVEFIYERKNQDDLRYIQTLLVDDKKIPGVPKVDYSLYPLPENYFDFSNAYGSATKGSCKAKISLFEIKDFNRNLIIFADEFTTPSFEYRESYFTFSQDKLKVFTTSDFKIPHIHLSYYRYPKQLKLINPENPEEGFDDSFELDFDEKVINRILDMTVSIFDINEDNPRYQINYQMAKTK